MMDHLFIEVFLICMQRMMMIKMSMVGINVISRADVYTKCEDALSPRNSSRPGFRKKNFTPFSISLGTLIFGNNFFCYFIFLLFGNVFF